MTDELSIRIRGDEAASPLALQIRTALEAAFELNTKLPPEILNMPGASGRKYRMLINHLMGSIPNPRYLEIGSYMGSTACSAIYGNRLRITCIDNWSQFGGPREAFMANIHLYKGDDVEFSLIEEDFRKVQYERIGNFNVFLFDGPHTYNDQFDGALVSLPALDNEYVFVVDDWNWPQVRAGTLDALQSKEKLILYSIEIRTTQDDSHASAEGPDGDWHNGYFISVVRQRQQDQAPSGFSELMRRWMRRKSSRQSDERQLDHALKVRGKTDKATPAYFPAPVLDQALHAASHPSLHYIMTQQRTYLFVEKATGRVHHGSEIVEGGLALLYFELEPDTKYGFFTPAGLLDRFHCGDTASLGNVLPVRRIQLSARTVAFQHLFDNTFLSAEGQPSTEVVFDRDEAREWEAFSLHRIRWASIPQCCALAAALVSLLRAPLSARSHADIILSYPPSDQDALLALCFDCVSMDEFVAVLDIVGAWLPRLPSGDGLLQQLVELRAASRSDNPLVPKCLLQPDDEESRFWVERVLPDLMAWRRDRNRFIGPNHHARLDTDLDFLQRLEAGVSIGSPGRLHNFVARFTSKPTRGICAVATARNEGAYLLEWLAYHKSIGVETFFIYSNNNDDGSDALLRRLSEAGAIHWLESIVGDETSPQFKAYNHALNVLPHVLDYRWAIFIDLDEFLVINPDRFVGLSDYVTWQEQQPVDAIGFNWVWISSSGVDKWSPDFVRSRFTKRYTGMTPTQGSGGPDRHIKSMFRPQRFLACQVHYPVTDWRVPIAMRDSSGYPYLGYYGGKGTERAFSLHPKAEVAWINHYFFKSAEEFVWKRWRNVGSEKLSASLLRHEWLAIFSSQHWSTDVVHDDRILHCGRGFQECYDSLLSIEGVHEILEDIRDTFCNGVKSIIVQMLNDPALNDSDEPVRRFLSCLRA